MDLGFVEGQLNGGLPVGTRIDGGDSTDLDTVQLDLRVGIENKSGSRRDHCHRQALTEVPPKQADRQRDDPDERCDGDQTGKWPPYWGCTV